VYSIVRSLHIHTLRNNVGSVLCFAQKLIHIHAHARTHARTHTHTPNICVQLFFSVMSGMEHGAAPIRRCRGTGREARQTVASMTTCCPMRTITCKCLFCVPGRWWWTILLAQSADSHIACEEHVDVCVCVCARAGANQFACVALASMRDIVEFCMQYACGCVCMLV